MGVKGFEVPIPEWALKAGGFLSGALCKISRNPSFLNREKVKEMVERNWTCDIQRAKVGLYFEPCILLPEGAGLTVDWYKRENWL
jgi:nucleoside-diphosphate-sugar epimerase